MSGREVDDRRPGRRGVPRGAVVLTVLAAVTFQLHVLDLSGSAGTWARAWWRSRA